MAPANERHILEAGSNCWRIEHARRAAFLIDGEACFRAVREAILQARHSVYILGWDIHSRLALVREEQDDGYPRRLGKLLNAVARRHGVEVYVLSWDFAMIFAMEREPLPRLTLNWKADRHVHFHLDDKHPTGASQHQKVVVVDDTVAFSGGLDLSDWRWDRPQHRIDDPLRVDSGGKPYPPFHDVQMVVDGAAAAALGDLARERWRRATAEELDPPRLLPPHHDPWPASVEPVLRDVAVGISRTLAEHEGEAGVSEVERLYLDSIAAAESFIYIENQYLTAHCIRKALVERLEQDHPPEIIIVLPEKTGGWLEQYTMDVLRARLLGRLRQIDDGKRLRIYYPQLASDSPVSLMVHAKVMIVDDRLVRVASSNLSNRSMGLDSECDLSVEAAPDSEAQAAIRAFRERLLAEHLGASPAQVADALQRHHSLIEAIESLRGAERTLQPLSGEVDADIDQMVPDSVLLDPERPIDSRRFVEYIVPGQHRRHTFRRVLLTLLTLAVLLGLAAAWRWTSLGEAVRVDALVGYAASIDAHPATPLLVTGGIALASVLMVPVTLLVVAAVLGFGPWAGFAYALAGAELGAVLSYALGQGIGRDLVRRYAGARLNSVSRELSKRGLLTIVTLRIVPLAPFAVVNMVAGASHIRFRDFALGSLIGMLPGVLAIALFADRLVHAMRSPDSGSFATLAVVVALMLGLILWLRKWLRGRQAGVPGESKSGA